MSGHTSGPWTTSTEIHGLGGIVASLGQTLDDESHFVCASVLVGDEDLPANARLIAAAPDLLEAAKSVIAGYGRLFLEAQTSDWVALQAAIAKAEGAS